MKTETYTDAEAFMQALHGKPRQKRGRNTRPDIPSAGRSAPTGLGPLILKGWSTAFDVNLGYRLYVINQPDKDTGWHADEKAACDAAKHPHAEE